jgi:hypothetical protein
VAIWLCALAIEYANRAVSFGGVFGELAITYTDHRPPLIGGSRCGARSQDCAEPLLDRHECLLDGLTVDRDDACAGFLELAAH